MVKYKNHEEDNSSNKCKVNEWITKTEANWGNMTVTSNHSGMWSGNKT